MYKLREAGGGFWVSFEGEGIDINIVGTLDEVRCQEIETIMNVFMFTPPKYC